MKKNLIIGAVVGAVVLATAGFYAGMTYAKSNVPMRGMFANAQFGGRMGMGMGARGGGGFVSGQVLSKDATSLTVKLPDGSTKLVLLSASTTVMKTTTGSQSDLTAGTEVLVTGAANQDGSVSAQSVQLRPAPRGQ